MDVDNEITVKQAAKLLDIHHSTLRRMINRGTLAHCARQDRFGNWLLDKIQVRKFSKSHIKYHRYQHQ